MPATTQRGSRRHPWVMAALAGLAVTQALPADLICPNGQNAPCGVQYSVRFYSSQGPLNDTQRQHYCDTMREVGRKIWVMTEGKHYLDRVEFGWDGFNADAVWNRDRGAAYFDGFQTVLMYDAFVRCTTGGDESCASQQELWDLPPGDFKCNIEADLWNPAVGSETTYRFCSYDGGTEYPADAVKSPWNQKAAIMAHEIGHQYYNLDDEYTYPDNPQGWPWSIRVCDNETDDVCIMARVHRAFMCDNGYDYNNPNQPISWSHVSNTCEPHFTGDPEYCGGDYPNGVTCDDDTDTCRWGTITNAKQHSCWSLARGQHVDLDNTHEQVGVYPSEASLGDPPKQADCLWSEGFDEDQVMLLDRSGSMKYVGPSGEQAVKEAADAALYFFNHGALGKENGVLAFNESFTWLKDYQGNFQEGDQSSQWDPPFDNPSGGVTASGDTDICGAIIEMTNAVRATHPSKNYAEEEDRDVVHAILLSDGKQTVDYEGVECYLDVAARLACRPEVLEWDYGDPYPSPDPQAPEIRIHSLAYGDFDPAALYDISTECKGTVWAAGQTDTSQNIQEPDPHELKTYVARSSTLARDLDELLDTRELVDPGGIESKIFQVPAGSVSLEFTWLGSRYWAESDGVECGFQKLKDFELESPSGSVHTASAVGPAVNENYHWTKSLRVADPEPGTWTARFDGSDLGCPQSHALNVAWLASVENAGLMAATWASPQRANVATPVNIAARLRYDGFDVTEIQATARVYHAGQEWVVTLHDDGEHGDVGIGDGLYGGFFNPDGNNMPSGNYAVKVRLKSHESVALDAATHQPGPGTASVQVETFFRLDTGYTLPDQDGNTHHGSVIPLFGNLLQGQTYPRLQVEVVGLPLIEKETIVSLGPRIRITNPQIQFDYPFEVGYITFDAEVLADAATGPRDIAVQVGPSQARAVDAVLVDCAGPGGATPGEVPNLSLGKPLRGGDLRLSWDLAVSADDGHTIYEGLLDGRFDSLVCNGDRVPPGVSGQTITSSPGSRYYLVRGVNEAAGRCGGHREGPVGLDSRGMPRLAAQNPCP